MINKMTETYIPLEDLDELSPADEGSVNLYYGLIRSGKTYGATADIIEELEQGKVVYATWPVLVSSYDDRRDPFRLLASLLFPWRRRFYVIDLARNFHYINAETGEVDGVKAFDPADPHGYINYLNSLNHCSLYIDEAWRVIDSYKGVTVGTDVRNLILVTGHKYRTVNLIAQRPTSIHVTARGNVNRFYRFEKAYFFGFPRFARTEFQSMTGETVDETSDPVSVKTYWGSSKIFNAYNSWYYGDLEPLHRPYFCAYDLSYTTRARYLAELMFAPLWRRIFGAVAPSDDIGAERPPESSGFRHVSEFLPLSPEKVESSVYYEHLMKAKNER